MKKKTASAIMLTLFLITQASGVVLVDLGICELGTDVGTDPIVSSFAAEYVVTGSERGSAFYFPSNEDGTFGSRSVIYSERIVDGIAIADFDNDADLDFVLGDGNTDSIVLLRNDGSGVYTPLTIATGVLGGSTCFFSQFRAADFDGDGKMDFVAGGFVTSPERQFVFINQGENSFESSSMDVSWRSGYIFIKDVGDFNNDGRQDVLIGDVYGASSGKVYYYEGKGDGTFETPILVINLLADHGQSNPFGLAADDFDLDGRIDVVIGGDGSTGDPHGEFWFYKGNGDGTFTAGASVFNLKGAATLAMVGVDAYDFDKDTKPDVVGYNWNGRQLWFVQGKGDGTFESPQLVDNLPASGVGIAAPPSMPISRPVVQATVDIKPGVLNMKSKAKWITVHIELPEGYNAYDIDVCTVMINDTIQAEVHPTEVDDYNDNNILDLMVKFDRQEVAALLSVDEATLTITGEVNDTPFEGSDTIRIRGK